MKLSTNVTRCLMLTFLLIPMTAECTSADQNLDSFASNSNVEIDCTAVKQNIISASKKVETIVLNLAEEKLPFFLDKIQQDEESKLGFNNREDINNAVVGKKAYQMYTRCDLIDYPTNMWRVPVIVNEQVRALLTIDWVENSWQAVDFGASKLSAKVSEVENKSINTKSLDRESNSHHIIIRDYQNMTDYLTIKTFPSEKTAIRTDAILSFPEVIQEQDEWCWAGVSASIFDYFNSSVGQCEIAEFTRTEATWHDFGLENCCVNPNVGCNNWNYNWGQAGSIENILESMQETVNIQNYGVSRKLTINEVETDLSDDKPFIIRWGWDSGGGHFLVGYSLDGNYLHYMNPWFGEGSKIGTYDWVSIGGGHTWTHTNRITDVVLHGDINGDKHTTLVDLILSLQLLVGNDNIPANLNSDANSDDVIGMAESIYLLRKFAE